VKIGKGCFGEILKTATLNESNIPKLSNNNFKTQGIEDINEHDNISVLVKELPKNYDDTKFNEYQRQICLHSIINCQNVANLIAICFEIDYNCIVLENSQDLRHFLKTNLILTPQNLINYCLQLSNGLKAIAESNLIHK
jgi:serine/threonine protein kinase